MKLAVHLLADEQVTREQDAHSQVVEDLCTSLPVSNTTCPAHIKHIQGMDVHMYHNSSMHSILRGCGKVSFSNCL